MKKYTLMRLRISFVLLCWILLFLSACSNQDGSEVFESKVFDNDQSIVTLAFDLRNDNLHIAGLLINAQNFVTTTHKTIALPFSSRHVSLNKGIFSTWGSYEETTLVSYYLTPATSGIYSIGMVPSLEPAPEIYTDPDDVESSLSFIKLGLERIFIYKYPDTDPYRVKWLQDVSVISNTEIDLIGVVLPNDAVGKEIRGTGLTEIPRHVFENRQAKFYPANGVTAGEKALEIKYELPPTRNQEIFLEYGIKLFAIILAPLAKLIIDKPEIPEDKNKKRHEIIITSLVGFEILIIILLMIFMFLRGDSMLERSLDLIIIVIGAGMTAYVVWREKLNDQ